MVIVLEAQMAVTPAGRPVAVPMPDAPVVTCVIFVKEVWTHKDGMEEATLTVFPDVTVILPVALTLSQPPVKGMI
jgi:hypothetical protein